MLSDYIGSHSFLYSLLQNKGLMAINLDLNPLEHQMPAKNAYINFCRGLAHLLVL